MMLCNKIDKVELPLFIAAIKKGDWVAEEKYDGDRMTLGNKEKIVLTTRGKSGDVTYRYPEVHNFACEHEVLLDGEMCVLDENGLSQFNEGIAFRTHCQNPEKIEAGVKNYPVTYVVFDILECDGEDLRNKPWNERRLILESLKLDQDHLTVTDYSIDIMDLWQEVTARGGEGIILKKLDAPYLANKRSSLWKKVKDIKEADIRVIAYQPNPKGIRVETEEGIACQISGYHAPPVQKKLDANGECMITIRHLGWTGKKFRQPTFAKVVVQ